METWAYCGDCERWFYVPASDEIRLDHLCPACESVATKVVSSGDEALTTTVAHARR